MITIAVVNESMVVTNTEARHAVAAVRKQVTRDFAPLWGVAARVRFFPDAETVPLDAWVVAILDDSDQAGALGYHDVTPAGLPVAKVFAKVDLALGLSWTITLSHEVLEMLGDAYCDLCVQVRVGPPALFLAYENCDAPEGDQFGYQIGDVWVSDFVTKSWFSAKGHKPYDFCGHLAHPLSLLAGGYASWWSQDKGWTQAFAEAEPGHKSRQVRARRIPHRVRGRKVNQITIPPGRITEYLS